METKQLETDASFMDKYSRQIGAFGIETMAKVTTERSSFERSAVRVNPMDDSRLIERSW